MSRDPSTRVCHVTCCRGVRRDAPLGHATGVVLPVDLLHRRRGDVRRQHRRVAHRAAVRAARRLTRRPRRSVAVHLRHPQVVRSRVDLQRGYFRSLIVVVCVSVYSSRVTYLFVRPTVRLVVCSFVRSIVRSFGRTESERACGMADRERTLVVSLQLFLIKLLEYHRSK